MDEPTRRAWNKPELIVLVRSGPEEAVLTLCKNVRQLLAATNAAANCMQYVVCVSCDDLSTS